MIGVEFATQVIQRTLYHWKRMLRIRAARAADAVTTFSPARDTYMYGYLWGKREVRMGRVAGLRAHVASVHANRTVTPFDEGAEDALSDARWAAGAGEVRS